MISRQSVPCNVMCVASLLWTAALPAGEPQAEGISSGQTVYVAVSRAPLHSGPSAEFYPTGFATRGAMLEVYHHTDDNWLGIRPPQGSFSWVAATDAYLLPGGRVIEITTDLAVSWIGTELGSARQYRWQVQLNRGEQLAVLGEKTSTGEGGKETLWYQIAPPSGEFRWIETKAVSSKPVAMPSVAAKTGAESASTSANSQQEAGSLPNSQVVQAQYLHTSSPVLQDEVFFEESIPGEYYDMPAPYYSPDGMPAELMDDGHVYHSAGPRLASTSSDPFAGWHAMDLTDDGLQFTLLRRLFGRKPAPAHDPLNQDPFDLSMASSSPRVHSPVAGPAPIVRHTDVPSVPSRDGRGWRDPRTLRGGLSRSTRSPLVAPDLSTRESALSRSPLAVNRMAAAGDEDYEPESQEGGPKTLRSLLASSVQPAQIQPATQVDWYGVGESVARSSDNGAMLTTNLDLNQLQLNLSEIVTQPMQLWSLQPLYDQVQYYVEHGGTAIERGQARLLIERIEEFGELAKKSGYLALNPNPHDNRFAGNSLVRPAGASMNAFNASPSAVVSSDFQRAVGGGVSYDATGWLVPVLAASSGQPTHAITDTTGQILAYVSGLPGMNLDRYVNQAVGITGLRGYLPQLQAGHIQAQRIVRLQ